MNNIGHIIKEQRIKKNITLKKLSKLSDISISTLYKIENDKLKKIKGVFLYRLSNILNIDYDYLNRQRSDILPTFFYERNRSIGSK